MIKKHNTNDNLMNQVKINHQKNVKKEEIIDVFDD